MTIVSAADRKRVAEAINAAERQTSGEIVAVIAGESASYAYAPFLWAALVALAVPFPLIFWTWWPIQHIYILQLVVFIALLLLFMYRPLRLSLVSQRVKKERAHRRAVEQFLAQNLHTTPSRTGVLIFVSVAERFAEIIADAGINEKVPEGTWQVIIDRLTKDIGDGQAVDGFVRAVEAVGGELARHFPPGSHDPNAFANHLIVLPS
ncbi:MAG TPA: TPM domain-containing protein [Hyphomicrobiaceae bacterium]|jgi:putative membrane protein|nr:TPM domain-containing protein [Hyphomicrobiaceae bacterium]